MVAGDGGRRTGRGSPSLDRRPSERTTDANSPGHPTPTAALHRPAQVLRHHRATRVPFPKLALAHGSVWLAYLYKDGGGGHIALATPCGSLVHGRLCQPRIR